MPHSLIALIAITYGDEGDREEILAAASRLLAKPYRWANSPRRAAGSRRRLIARFLRDVKAVCVSL